MATLDPEVDLSIAACNELIELAHQASSVADIHALCSHLCERARFDHFLYGTVLPVSMVRPQVFIISGYPTDWWARYQRNNYLAIDPVVHHMTTRQTVPLIWSDIDPTAYHASAGVRDFMREAADFGLNAGVSFPVHGQNGEYAVLSLATRDDDGRARPRVNTVLPFAQLLTGYIHEAARRLFDESAMSVSRPGLTRRERECLLWAAEGKTSWDTALILDVSERTVLFHLQNAAHKLGVSNRTQAVARAVCHGYITPQFP